ncbi:MAG: glycosyltransferase family 4 protein [Bauldia sp.]|nr:glycosyltransferase family 4 protein [Bauldia sp.]
MSRRFRVLALVTDAFGAPGGIAQYNRDLLTTLAEEAGFEIVILARRGSAGETTPARGITQLRPRPGRIGYIAAALRAAATRRFDLVFCGHLYAAPLARAAARLRGSRLLVQLHGIDAWTAPRRQARKAFERADLVLSVSRFTRAAALGWSRLEPHRIAVIPNTVRDVFVPGDRRSSRLALGLDDRRVLLSVGRLDSREAYKGQDRIIDVLPGLIAGGRRVAYVVAGEGDDRIRLESLARERGVGDAVHFLGEIEEAGLPPLYRAADLFVMPSTGEGFGIVFLEAMASGTPALGLAAGGAPDAMADGALGTLVQAERLGPAIAAILDGAETDPAALSGAVAERFGRAAFRRAVGRLADRLAETS